MKRFLAFTYDEYYPGGGWSDFAGSFDTKEEAIDRLRPTKEHSYLEIVDTGAEGWPAIQIVKVSKP